MWIRVKGVERRHRIREYSNFPFQCAEEYALYSLNGTLHSSTRASRVARLATGFFCVSSNDGGELPPNSNVALSPFSVTLGEQHEIGS
jgi:hypothetical protein